MLFVMKVKKQKEQKEIFSSIDTGQSNLSSASFEIDKPSSKDEINLADNDQKPTHLD
jgi:hypothetical protein